jgi:hypothetical protein
MKFLLVFLVCTIKEQVKVLNFDFGFSVTNYSQLQQMFDLRDKLSETKISYEAWMFLGLDVSHVSDTDTYISTLNYVIFWNYYISVRVVSGVRLDISASMKINQSCTQA